MSITDSLQGVTRLFLDSAPVIYAVERNPQYLPLVRVVFERIFSGLPMGVVSPITLAECLVQPYRLGQNELQQDFIELMTDNQNIEFVPIDDETLAINAAEIRARYNLQLPDAFQITVALAAGCEAFLTNDVTFKRVTELRVLVLDDFNTSD
ncbi:type II toxin-antitoxin system VapC family toxin [Hassallia byssoidea VB512170]|uniref:Type II toxin-antitoxin system VapC family toxin n=1 Tax=Hassallia byssoidea VB512170 TaxID=1304833 RepID=A0A846H8Z2_9CYAN|nr:type II toxin-antitoxin system VapC family toxin [Hassalia byssoidea VB512170]